MQASESPDTHGMPSPAACGPRDILAVLLLLALSGNPACILTVENIGDIVIAGFSLIFFTAALLGRAPVVATQFRWVAMIFLTILLLQAFQFSFLPISTILGFACRLLVGAAFVHYTRNFPVAYVKAISYLSLYALAFYAIDQFSLALGLDFRGLFSPLEALIGIDADHRFALVISFMTDLDRFRNAAFFREPGLYAGYILLGFLFLFLSIDSFSRRQRAAYFLILLVSLITTFSYAGYVILPLVLLTGVLIARRSTLNTSRGRSATVFRSLFYTTCGTALCYFVLVPAAENPLIGRLMMEIQAVDMEEYGQEITRVGGFILDLDAIAVKPLLGWGLHSDTRFALTPELAAFSPSGGTSGWVRSFGLVGLFAYALSLYRGLLPCARRRAIVAGFATATILIIAQPNTFLNYPLFLGLMFLPWPKAKARLFGRPELPLRHQMHIS